MAAPQPSTSIVHPAPSVPPLTSWPTLAAYLQSLVLWITQRLQERQQSNQAQPFVLLQQSDATPGATPKVYKLTVDGTGALHTTVMTLGAQP